MEVDWMVAVERGGDYDEEMQRRDAAWTAAVRATAELEGEVLEVLPLSISEYRLLVVIRDSCYYIAFYDPTTDRIPPDLVGRELTKYMSMLGYIRQQRKEHNG